MNIKNLKIEPAPHRHIGGQQCGILPVSVKVTHVPTGISATCGSERSQTRNRDIAIEMVELGLAELGWRETEDS